MASNEPMPPARRVRLMIAGGVAAAVLIAAAIAVALASAPDGSPTAAPTQTSGRQPSATASTGAATSTLTPTNATSSDGGSPGSGSSGGAGAGSPGGNSPGGGTGVCCTNPWTRPAEPTSVTARAVDRTSIRVTWTDNADNETEYWILGPGNRVVLAANVTSYVWGGLQAGEGYCFQVAAANPGWVSTNYATGAWVCADTVPNPPAAPSNVVVTGSDRDTMVVKWTDNASNETEFRIMFADANHQELVIGIEYTNATIRAFDVPLAIEVGVQYCARVQAGNLGGYSSWSAWACGTSLPVPAMPSGVTATAIDATTIRFHWTDNSAIETRYRIYRDGFVTRRDAPANATSLDWTGLTPGTEICFYVTAENDQGYFARGPKVCATTPPA